MSYEALVLINKSVDLDLPKILDGLIRYAVIKTSENEAVIGVNDYKFKFTFRQKDSVLKEAKELLEGNEKLKNNFIPGDTRVEIYGPDDPDMDYFNDFILIVSQLAKHPSLLVYEQAGQEFI